MITEKTQNLIKVRALLKTFRTLWEEQNEKKANHTAKLYEIATQIVTMKLADEFFVSNLSEEDQTLLKDKVYVLIHL